MLQINQLKLAVEHSEAELKRKIEKELALKRIFKDTLNFSYKILRKSIDARRKPDVLFIYTILVDFNDETIEKKILIKCNNKNVSIYNPTIFKPYYNINHCCDKSPVIVGEGPCGLFAGLILAYAGLKPIIIERGDRVAERVKKVEKFWQTGKIDDNTNVQYGEGGAGTFSDGKLNTLVKDKTGKNQYVLDTFVKFGAKEECAYDAKPHVGTDILETVVKNIREEIEAYGGNVLNLHKMTDIVIDDGKISGIVVENLNNDEQDRSVIINTEDVILAIGHSARDTFDLLYSKGIQISQKNFAVGIRIQHSQKMIDDSQYGKGHSEKLPPSPYKVTNHTTNGRDVFSFCMCPGGYVVNASSKNGCTCINGMSYEDRSSGNANSALIVAIDRQDFNSDHPLAGVYLQEKLEKKTYEIGNGKIPVQLFGDYEKGVLSSSYNSVEPKFKGDTAFANLQEIFPKEINEAIIESINKFGYTIEGFDDKDSIIAAVESRTSSPIRINRDENFESNIKGLYPAGEGAGYAGGIMSAAMDGIKVAEAVIRKYEND
ncbi:MAG: FAD-dependent oxidoreductase [Lachnospiraceae bacterium]|nr:FAD-dependent oxidoreductase [Lachnospiraceae bacterium]